MKKLAWIIGAALIMMFGIHGMYHTMSPAVAPDQVPPKALESISADAAPRTQISFVKAVLVVDGPFFSAGDKVRRTQRCVFPVSLERVTNY